MQVAGRHGTTYSTFGRHAYTEDGLSYLRSTNDSVIYYTPTSSSSAEVAVDSVSSETSSSFNKDASLETILERRDMATTVVTETAGVEDAK